MGGAELEEENATLAVAGGARQSRRQPGRTGFHVPPIQHPSSCDPGVWTTLDALRHWWEHGYSALPGEAASVVLAMGTNAILAIWQAAAGAVTNNWHNLSPNGYGYTHVHIYI